jgi:ribosome-binding ATPase YchF (GTP1/OBG family)
MNEVYHIKIKKEYAAALIDDLIKIDAVEDMEALNTELPQWQKDALDKELQTIAEKEKINNAAKYKGILTKEEAEKFNVHIKQARTEWDSNI